MIKYQQKELAETATVSQKLVKKSVKINIWDDTIAINRTINRPRYRDKIVHFCPMFISWVCVDLFFGLPG